MKKAISNLVFIFFIFFSCEEIFYETDISEAVIEILAPTNNAELSIGTQTFSWKLIEGSEGYIIQIATPNFENATQIELDSITKETSMTKELVSNDYQWRIKALNSEYETAFTTASFKVKTDISDSVVAILAPANNAELSIGTQTFTWNPVEGAEEYVIQIATPDFENATQIVLDLNTTETSMTKDLIVNDYQWRIKAMNSGSETTYTTNSFSVLD